jgi:hypothetical protein
MFMVEINVWDGNNLKRYVWSSKNAIISNSSESFHRTRAGSGSVMANGWFRLERLREREREKKAEEIGY